MGISSGANITIGLGASVSIGAFWDEKGNFEWQWSYSVLNMDDTAMIGAIDLGGGIALQYTNRETIHDLHGPATYIGASGGPSWYVGGDVISFSPPANPSAEIDGVQLVAGVGFGLDVHVLVSNTKRVGTNHSTQKKKNSRGVSILGRELLLY